MKHFVIVAILVVLCTILVYIGLVSLGLLPQQASLQAVSIDKLFNIHLWLISFLFSLIVVNPDYTVWLSSDAERVRQAMGRHIAGNTRLEILWTLIPLGVVIFLAYIGAMSLAEVQRIDPSAMVVKVIGGQWFWKFQYLDYGILER